MRGITQVGSDNDIQRAPSSDGEHAGPRPAILDDPPAPKQYTTDIIQSQSPPRRGPNPYEGRWDDVSAADTNAIALERNPKKPLPSLMPVENGDGTATGVTGEPKPLVEIEDLQHYVDVGSQTNLEPGTIYKFEGRYYESDDLGRPMATSGVLTREGDKRRLKGVDTAIGHEGYPSDVGFHHGADQFRFAGGRLNLSPGNTRLNSGTYMDMEMFLRRQVEAGHEVEANFRAGYKANNDTIRPNYYIVQYQIDGGPTRERFFPNMDPDKVRN